MTNCTPVTRKTDSIYKSIKLHKAFNKGGLPILVKCSKYAKIKYRIYVNYYYFYQVL